MKPGVNDPIIINNRIIGVIGIIGNPNEVRRFVKLLNVTAVLLIEQAKSDEEIQDKRLNMHQFYYELSHRKTEYDDKFYQRAQNYGFDTTKKCKVILVDCDINPQGFKILCQRHSHYFNLDNSKTVFFISLSKFRNEEANNSLLPNFDKYANRLELIQTIQIYIEGNANINNVADRLYIHRNTVNYRLKKIKQLTGKSPKDLLELFELLCELVLR